MYLFCVVLCASPLAHGCLCLLMSYKDLLLQEMYLPSIFDGMQDICYIFLKKVYCYKQNNLLRYPKVPSCRVKVISQCGKNNYLAPSSVADPECIAYPGS
jgi:hypothetical protein